MNSQLSSRTQTPSQTGSSFLQWIRDAAIILAVTLALSCAIEFAVRTFAPQNLRTTFVNGRTLGTKDSVLGHVNTPGAVAKVTGPEFSVEYRINAQGLRDTALYTPKAAPGTTRILLLGDSFTQGSGNHYAQIWPVITEQNLRNAGHHVELIKAGTFAYDTRQETLLLERLYERYRPDIVVFGFVLHDLFTNAPIGDTSEESMDAVRAMASKKSDLHSVILGQRMLMNNDQLYSYLYLASGRKSWFSVPLDDHAREQAAVTRALFNRASHFCQEHGCKLMVLSIPQLYQVIERAEHGNSKGIDINWVDRTFSRIAKTEGYDWFPLLPELADSYRRTGQDPYYRYDGHLNANGNKIVADATTKILSDAIKKQASVHE